MTTHRDAPAFMSTTGPALARRPLILIIDDDVRSARLLARLLRGDGYDSEVTTDGAAALARLTRSPVPDVLITDFHLAHADGLAVGRYARSRRAAIPIFVITGDPNAVLRAADPADEPMVLLTKPVDYAELVHGLRSAVLAVSEATPAC